ncbi:MAG TPA: hypothetical protein VGO56_13995 [Pyrinomonadaceae bacterium]|nr:hypothetical protein [Pyrinomonadaceae bacterium]
MTFEQACKRKGGRRRYQAQLQRARDERQLIIMVILVEMNWPRHGIGRDLAKALSVDPATICRDLKYIRSWRTTLMGESKESEELVDAIIRRLVLASIHPRFGFSWTYKYIHRVSSLTVQRAARCRGGFRQSGKKTKNFNASTRAARILGTTVVHLCEMANVVPDCRPIAIAKQNGLSHSIKRLIRGELFIPYGRGCKRRRVRMERSEIEAMDKQKAIGQLIKIFGLRNLSKQKPT